MKFPDRPPKNTERARSLRRSQSDAERKVWSILRARRTDGVKFRRQVPVGRYFADFLCFECKLIIEVDGSHHLDQIDYDEERTRWLETQGYRVVRYWAVDVLLNEDNVVSDIWRHVEERRPKPP